MVDVSGVQLVANQNGNEGIKISFADAVDLTNVTVDNNAMSGLVITDATSVLVENVVATNNLESGVYLNNIFLVIHMFRNNIN